MPSSHNQDSKFEQLRKKAEELLQRRQDLNINPPSDMLELIHELKVHQVELEVQNNELKRAQYELSSLHQKYENLYEFAPCGYITLNSEGIITQANLTAVSLLNTNRSLLMHLGLSPFIAPGWTDHFFAARNKAAEAGEKQVIELPLRISNEKALWVQAYIEADLMQSGAVHEWRIILTDITERKRLEKEQNIITSEVRDLYENAPCGYHSLDKDGFFVRINSTELSWLGYTRDEIIGKKQFIDLLTARSVEKFKKNFPAFIKHGYVHNLEFEMIRKDGYNLAGDFKCHSCQG